MTKTPRPALPDTTDMLPTQEQADINRLFDAMVKTAAESGCGNNVVATVLSAMLAKITVECGHPSEDYKAVRHFKRQLEWTRTHKRKAAAGKG